MSRSVAEFKELHKLLDDIYIEASDQNISWPNLAIKADLAINTVYNLGNNVTQYPRASTVFALAKAVGFEVALVRKALNKRKSA